MSQPTVAQYLISCLAQLGATEFFGVAGSFNANLCSAVEACKDALWVGCCNELNVGYAADGYARTNEGFRNFGSTLNGEP